ncbi:hypothetical protein V8G54_013393 [Vigna mungo]|uniref:Uncharacterized protein n=1 Tax=Vigna mungo TaxID=3915 RepID=A0AAQ3S384_VIGMU
MIRNMVPHEDKIYPKLKSSCNLVFMALDPLFLSNIYIYISSRLSSKLHADLTFHSPLSASIKTLPTTTILNGKRYIKSSFFLNSLTMHLDHTFDYYYKTINYDV